MNKFDRRLERIPKEVWEKIAQIDELKGQWTGGLNMSPQVLGRLKKSVLVTSSGASTRIEGSVLSDSDVARLMHRGVVINKWADRDMQEVRGYYDVLGEVFDSYEDIEFTENTIKHFHKKILEHVPKDARHRGEYKKQENKVVALDSKGNEVGVIFEPTKAYLVPKQMSELVDWSQATLQTGEHHPLLNIGNFIVEFLGIHPFRDGNGRLSRILTNLLLLQAGYNYMPYVSHEKLIEDNKDAYYIALRKSQKSCKDGNGDITVWLIFFLDILLTQSQMAKKLLLSESIEDTLSPKQIVVWQYMQGVTEATQGEIAAQTGVVRPTVDQILRKLISLNQIVRIGEGRATRYRKR